MRKHYERILLGASCFALGCAAQKPDDTLILDSGEVLGAEFVGALRADGNPVLPGKAPAFFDELCARRITSPAAAKAGRLHLPAVGLVLNRLALEAGLHLLMRTRVLNIESAEGGYAVTAVCNARILEFTCEKLVDTRSTDFARIRGLDPAARFALACNLDVETDAERMGGLNLVPGFLPGEVFGYLPVDMPARGDLEALLSAFEARPSRFSDARLLRVAPVYAVWCAPVRETTQRGCFIPGSGFANPVQAWNAGLVEKEAFAR